MTKPQMSREVEIGPAMHVAGLALVATALLLAPSLATGQQGAPPPDDQVEIPDFSSWTVEQAVVNIRSSEKGTRMAALRRLAKEPGANIQKWIAESAQYDPEARIRYEAVMILAKRKESASLPILMHIAETDKDDRVRTAARAAVGAKEQPSPTPTPQPGAQPGAQPAQPQPKGQPGQPAAEQPAAPVEEKLYDEEGNELPPGYTEARLLDRQKESDEWMKTGQFSADEEVFVDVEKNERPHSGFMPVVGYDGAMGTPRDTLAITQAALQIGLARGTYVRKLESTYATTPIRGRNEFVQTDFSLNLKGRYAPIDFLELAVDVELLTVEKLDHKQSWTWLEGDAEGDKLDPGEMEYPERVFNDAGYSGAAFGLVSVGVKGLFLRTDLIRAGMVLRVTFPTHTGNRFDKGIGAPDLFRPTAEAGVDYVVTNSTRDGVMWGIEPGAVVSVAPIDSLTIYADFTYMITLLKYQTRQVLFRSGEREVRMNELNATNGYLLTHVGAQYRLLGETLGFQLALQPAFLLHGVSGGGLAAFGIVPGFFYRIADLIDTSLTFSFEAGSNAARPFVCTDLVPNDNTGSNPCGIGRRFGMALQAGYTF